MAVITNFYSVDNQIGTDLNNPQTISVTTNPEIPGPRSNLGDICQGIGGSQWVFVKASTTVTALNLVMLDESFNANNAVQVVGSVVSHTFALAEFQASNAQPGDYFWAAVQGRGGMLANVISTAAAGAQLYLSSSVPGVLTTTVSSSASNALIRTGFVSGSALVSTTAAVEISFAFMQVSV
jgi:hypothetical protein